MQSVKDVIGTFYKKVPIDKKYCDKCDRQYDVYEYYIRGEYKGIIDFCEVCYKEEQNLEIAREAKKHRSLAILNKYNNISVVPYGLEKATFESYIPVTQSQKEALRISKEFANGGYDKTTLFFQGDTGLGKTHLSYSVYKTFNDNEKPSIFVDLPSLLTMIRGTFKKYDNYKDLNQEIIMKSLQECELLVLDDVGAEYVKPDANGFESWAADILFQIVNARQGKRTIYTTNFTSKQLSQKYGMMSKRIISRMMNNAKVLKMDGQDYRLKGLD